MSKFNKPDGASSSQFVDQLLAEYRMQDASTVAAGAAGVASAAGGSIARSQNSSLDFSMLADERTIDMRSMKATPARPPVLLAKNQHQHQHQSPDVATAACFEPAEMTGRSTEYVRSSSATARSSTGGRSSQAASSSSPPTSSSSSSSSSSASRLAEQFASLLPSQSRPPAAQRRGGGTLADCMSDRSMLMSTEEILSQSLAEDVRRSVAGLSQLKQRQSYSSNIVMAGDGAGANGALGRPSTASQTPSVAHTADMSFDSKASFNDGGSGGCGNFGTEWRNANGVPTQSEEEDVWGVQMPRPSSHLLRSMQQQLDEADATFRSSNVSVTN